MFFSVPCSASSTIVTPIEAKSVTHIFFQPKNERLWRADVDNSGAYVSILIDGKQICKDLLILPFCTQTPTSTCTFDWRQVAIEVNLNVSQSEIKISRSDTATYDTDDYNVVFVCSAKETDESKGFEFFETKRIALCRAPMDFTQEINLRWDEAVLRLKMAMAQKMNEENERLNAANKEANDNAEEGAPPLPTNAKTDYQATDEAVFDRLWEQEGQGITNKDGERVLAASITLVLGGIRREYKVVYPRYKNRRGTWDLDGTDSYSLAYVDVLAGYHFMSPELYGRNTWDLQFDHAPAFVFAYGVMQLGAQTAYLTDNFVRMRVEIDGTENEALPYGTDISVMSATKHTPMREALYEFDSEVGMRKNVTLRLTPPTVRFDDASGKSTRSGACVLGEIPAANPTMWSIFFFFGYRKLA